MLRLAFGRHAFGVGLAATLLAGCGGSQASIGGAVPQTLRPGERTDATGYGWINVYLPGKSKPIRTITTGVYDPFAMAFDKEGNLYVADIPSLIDNPYPTSVNVYAANSSRLLRQIFQGLGGPDALAFDKSANLYVANGHNNYPGSVTVYAPGKTKLQRTITDGINVPSSLSFDDNGNLYVSNPIGNDVTVYRPGESKPQRSIEPCGGNAALDKSGNFYVVDPSTKPPKGREYSSVSVYSDWGRKLLRTLRLPSGFLRLSLGPDGLLYVANAHRNSVHVFSRAGTKSLYTITQGISNPSAVAFDEKGNLYVSNSHAVTIYPSGQSQLSREIQIGPHYAGPIAFDKAGRLYVGVTE
jgi:sugar lactone lactonase YvrE